MRGLIPELVVGLGADVRTPLAERLDEAEPTQAELDAASQVRSLVEGLPAGGSVLIVHSPTVVGAYRELIQDLRGPVIAAATKVFAAPALRDELTLTRNLSLPVVRAPLVEEQRRYRRALAQAWRL